MAQVKPRTVKLSAKELSNLIDRESKKRLGIDGATFVLRYHRKELPDSPASREIGTLVQLATSKDGREVPERLRRLSKRDPQPSGHR